MIFNKKNITHTLLSTIQSLLLQHADYFINILGHFKDENGFKNMFYIVAFEINLFFIFFRNLTILNIKRFMLKVFLINQIYYFIHNTFRKYGF